MAKPLPKLERESTGLKLFPVFSLLGWLLIGFSIIIAVVVLSPTGAAYWGDNAKVARDAAGAGSGLLGDLTVLSVWPKILPPLIFLGVASFMVGIALEFAAIPNILDRRAKVLKEALPLMGRN